VERNIGSTGEMLSWALRGIGSLARAAGEEQKERIGSTCLSYTLTTGLESMVKRPEEWFRF
jgi:hypothetical protein